MNKDIDFLIDELDHASASLDEPKVLRAFTSRHAGRLVELLEELKTRRDESDQRAVSLIEQDAKRIVVEGFSDENMHAAFSDALSKVTGYFSEHHDASVVVLGLVELPKGGYRATLEVILTPMKASHTEHLESAYLELKRIHKQQLDRNEAYQHDHLKHLIHDHFLVTSGTAPEIPDCFLINVHEADLLNMMIENQFFRATSGVPEPSDTPSKVMVRVLRPGQGDGS